MILVENDLTAGLPYGHAGTTGLRELGEKPPCGLLDLQAARDCSKFVGASCSKWNYFAGSSVDAQRTQEAQGSSSRPRGSFEGGSQEGNKIHKTLAMVKKLLPSQGISGLAVDIVAVDVTRA